VVASLRLCQLGRFPRPREAPPIDISPEELELNADVTEDHAAGVAAGLPMPDTSVDVVLSRALLEHVGGVSAAILHMARVLRSGGVALHFCAVSLLAVRGDLEAASIPPASLADVHIDAEYAGSAGFPVHHDHGHPQAPEQEFRVAGFSYIKLQGTWAYPGYFFAVYPLFLLSGPL
jgi:SAM-dependent methyltransferase